MTKHLEIPCAVVGTGILGLCTALVLARVGVPVVLFKEPDGDGPSADTQRNHCWIQSGLMYAGTFPFVASRMFLWGRRLLREGEGFVDPTSRTGVMRVKSEGAAKRFEAHARKLGLDHRINRLTREEMEDQLGVFSDPDSYCFSVPDAIFPEAQLLEALRFSARSLGVILREAHAEPLRRTSGLGVDLQVGHTIIRPALTILAAGAANVRMMNALGFAHPLMVDRSALLTMSGSALMKSSLLVDLDTSLAVASHMPSRSVPVGCTVIGNRARKRMSPKDLPYREVLPIEAEAVIGLLPETLQAEARAGRFTAGYKTESKLHIPIPIVSSIGTHMRDTTVEPWIGTAPDYPGLIVANPGKATMSLWTAYEVWETVVRRLPALAQQIRRGKAPSPHSLPGVEWHTPIYMHHEAYYNGTNDLRASNSREASDGQ